MLSYYRHRHGNAPGAPRCATQQALLDQKPKITVPAIFATGLADACNLSASSLCQEQWFTASYQRVELPGIGHFVPREAPAEVARLIRRALRPHCLTRIAYAPVRQVLHVSLADVEPTTANLFKQPSS